MENNEPISFNSLEEYKTHFQPIFTVDCAFSQKFRVLVNQIVLRNVATIYNHECRENEEDKKKDSEGKDMTVVFPQVHFGLRVRRDKEYYLGKAEFTVDVKEWETNIRDRYYIYAYGTVEEKPRFRLWVFFDYQELKKAQEDGKMRGILEHNKDHSSVAFWCFKLSEMFRLGLILDWGGERELVQQVLGEKATEPRNQQLASYF